MIAKRIMTKAGGSGFRRLAGYVLNVKAEHLTGTDPASWERLGAYILDAAHDGEKVAWAKATGCGHDDPGWAVKAILATQAMNTRAAGDKSYHLVASFPEGEIPTREQMEDIEDTLVAAIGFQDHQRVSAVHQNTGHWHLHVAINKVHPTTLRNVSPWQDHFKLQEACAELEIRHGLTLEPHTVNHEQSRGFDRQLGAGSFAAWAKDHAAAPLLAARDSGEGWQEVHRAAAALDLVVKLRGAGLVVGHRSDSRLRVKASDVDAGLSFKSMTDALGAFEAPGQQADAEPASARYDRPGQQGGLFDAYKRERAAAEEARKDVLKALQEHHAAYTATLVAYHKERTRLEREAGLRGPLQQRGREYLAARRKIDHAKRKDDQRQERKAVRAAHALPTWQGFLEEQAARGNEEEVTAMRNRQQHRGGADAHAVGAKIVDQARQGEGYER